MAEVREGQGDLVFGLDIGTRSIVGTVGKLDGSKFYVMAQCTKEHETRAMLDGQIHDIKQVGGTILQVKEALEEMLQIELTDVCIAAAGRVLRTVTVLAEQTFDNDREVSEEDINALVTLGVEKAYEEFYKSNDSDIKFYCVGYTTMRYYLNGYPITNLEGHKAKKIGIDVIGTFLPDDVVDGLYKAVELAGLQVMNLTLEPIAAIQVAIPEKFRMLNMALVDVGAGTSDISITKDGTITAYGMIPVAGDSLTDAIMQHCLVDFDSAETIKRNYSTEEVLEYTDVFGMQQTITSAEVSELLKGPVEQLAKMVADCIRELNGDKAVSAVFVVGGGGIIGGYTEYLADQLGIVKERVAIRGQEVMQNIIFEMEDARKDSMMVTPVGICLSYYEQSNNFIFIEFNGEYVKLYNTGKLNVADAAVQSQIPNEDLFPKRGKTLTFVVNGNGRVVRGRPGEAAVIRLNDVTSDIYGRVHNGDKIELIPSTAGEPASQELGKLAEMSEQLHIYVNGDLLTFPKCAEVNGVRQSEFYQIQENDEIVIRDFYTVSEIAEYLDIPLGEFIMVNAASADEDTKVYENFVVSWSDGTESLYENSKKNVISEEHIEKEEPEDALKNEVYSVDDESPECVKYEASLGENDEVKDAHADKEAATIASQPAPKPASLSNDIYVIVNGQAYGLKGKSRYVFVDIFDVINFELTHARGRTIVTLLNGRPAEYMEEIREGDIIEVYWQER